MWCYSASWKTPRKMFKRLNRLIFSFKYWKIGNKAASTPTERVSPSNELNTESNPMSDESIA